MGVLVLMLALVAPAGGNTPPLKTITTVRASVFCGILRDTVAPASVALARNTPVTAQGRDIVLDMAQVAVHSASPAAPIRLDAVKLNRIVGVLVGNLQSVDSALRSLDRLPALSKTEDQQHLRELRDGLSAIATMQRKMLDAISGTATSFSSNDLQAMADPVPGNQRDAALLAQQQQAEMHGTLPFATDFAHLYDALNHYQAAQNAMQAIESSMISQADSHCQ